LFETTNGERAWIIRGPDFEGDFFIAVGGDDSCYFNSKGQTPSGSYTLSHRLPVTDPITALERAVVNAAIDVRLVTSVININALDDATDALLAARKPHPRRVDSVDALMDVFAAARLSMTAAQASAVFNALQELKE